MDKRAFPQDEATLREMLDYLCRKHNITPAELATRLAAEQAVPASVFSSRLSPFEAIVKYLREQKGYRLSEIGRITGRDQRAIGVTYRRAKEKVPEPVVPRPTLNTIPIAIFKDRSLSILEHVVVYLREEHRLSYREIANILKRDSRTIGTVARRAREKTVTKHNL